MASASWFDLGAAVVCLVLVALASAVETALIHVNRHRLRDGESEAPTTRSVETMLERQRAYGSAMVLLETLAAGLLVAFLSDLFLRERLPGGLWLALLIAVPVLVVFGRGLPRALARRDPPRTASALRGFAWLAVMLASPFTALYSALMRLLLRLLRRSRPKEIEPPTEEEFTALLTDERKDEFGGLIEDNEREMIDNILHLEERTARDIMVPRIDIVAVPETANLATVVETMQHAGHSRVPVYSASVDQIIGVLYAKDLLRFVTPQAQRVNIVSLVRPPYIVPESKRLDDLLREFRSRKVHMAIVADEYGGTAGILTMEDILEEIVGEIHDEYDLTTAPLLEQISAEEWLVDGRISAEDVSDLLDLGWTAEEHGTLGGLVQRELGRLPVEGEELEFSGARITVMAVDRHRLRRLRLRKLRPVDAGVAGSNGSLTDHAEETGEP